MRYTTDLPAAVVRPIRCDDQLAVKNLLASLSPGSTYFRFGGFSAPEFTAEQWRNLCAPDPARGANFVAVQSDNLGSDRVIAVARLVFRATDEATEFSLVIGDHHQSQGLGRRVMHYLIDQCRRRGITMLYGDVLPSNLRMVRFCQELGFVSLPCPNETRIHRMTLSVNPNQSDASPMAASWSASNQARLRA
jgi:acetyltransferase